MRLLPHYRNTAMRPAHGAQGHLGARGLPGRDRSAGRYGGRGLGGEAGHYIGGHGPGDKGQDGGSGQRKARATMALAQRRAPVAEVVRSAAARRGVEAGCGVWHGARFHLGAGQAAEHSEVTSEEQGKHAHPGQRYGG